MLCIDRLSSESNNEDDHLEKLSTCLPRQSVALYISFMDDNVIRL